MLACGAAPLTSALLGVYGGVMSIRQFGRSFAYVENRPLAVAASDVTYSAGLLLGPRRAVCGGRLFSSARLPRCWRPRRPAPWCRSDAPICGACWARGLTGWLPAYRNTFRDLARWSLLGVVSTEMTVNAHAYLVTLIAGPQSFALLAAGALFLRPVSLFLTALPEMERPAMARGLISGDHAAAFRAVRNFAGQPRRCGCSPPRWRRAILIWFPTLCCGGAMTRATLPSSPRCGPAIMAVRILRTPDRVFLQAATEFRPLALASVVSAGASLVVHARGAIAVGTCRFADRHSRRRDRADGAHSHAGPALEAMP